ncbi:MAG: thiopurine S-methyltransferase [Pseudomonadota bacterium]
MHPDFWRQRWADNQIAFHEAQANPLLVAYFEALALPPGSRVFVPFCGKTLDIDWLLSSGFRVSGAELSSKAVAQLFERLGASPTVDGLGSIERLSVTGLDIFAGDFFHLTAGMLGAVDAVYDRAALIALPPAMRGSYARHLRAITADAPQLLVTLDYDQTVVDGPPFSVPEAEVRKLYSGSSPVLLSSQFQPAGLKGKFPVKEAVWKIIR